MDNKTNHTRHFIQALPKNIFSGFVVSLIALPLGLGLALASEAPPISGVIAAIAGGVVVSILGGSNVTIAGPGNGLVIVLLGAITTLGAGDVYQGYLYTLAAIIISGLLLLLLGFLKMGRLADFFPASAIQGMLAAIGIGILAKQFHVMIGKNNTRGSIVDLLIQIPNGLLDLARNPDPEILFAAGIGIMSLLVMIFYAKIRNAYFQLVPAPMWILILTIVLSYVYTFANTPYPLGDQFLIALPDNIISSWRGPDFSAWNQKEFFLAVIAITLIASIESLLSIKAIDKLDPVGRRSNVNKDLKALGLATVVSGMLGGLNVVTVIARSSVNVNNGATNRSSNFFHALFLILFILLFQSQLKRIPLAALAAILVYTGYKLATPQTFKRIAQVGWEQLVIFMATLLTTLFTNLITGIGFGILVTFILHVFLNRNLGLFLNHLRKPNILLYQETDVGNYYVSVKHFCSFLNFYKLKNKLDVIPENEDVVLDFSMCQFVDHTVLEGLGHYMGTFQKKGGNVEIIGLDILETGSLHPFAIRKTLPLSSLKPIERYFTKRQEGLKAASEGFGWTYIPERSFKKDYLNFVFFHTREIRYTYNQLVSEDKECRVLDMEFSEGEFIAKEVVKTSAMHMELDAPLPSFTLDREGLLQWLYGVAGFHDIDIPKHPDFNRRFYLLGDNPDAIREVFTDELVLFLESHPYYHIESNGKAILVLKKERLLGVQEIKSMIYFGLQLKRILHPKTVRIS
ncbi:MAG: SulP family inorganic anion transporter [Eudoraea sp.]|nr:SulP family inorganic anion transporter [Eudoraea sp.]NNJ41207.1 SulP family inorganic anion transporter [Eudoraea sp.]